MTTPGTVPNSGVGAIQSNPNSQSNGQVKILVGNETKPAQLLNAAKNNEAGITVIIPGNLSSSAVQNLIAFFKNNANSFRITHLEVADGKLTLALKAADKTKQATMTNAAFQLTGAAVSGVWVGRAMYKSSATPNSLGANQPPSKLGGNQSPGTGKLPDDKLDAPFSQALDDRPRGPANSRARDFDGGASNLDCMTSAKGANLQAHIQMSQAFQAGAGGIGSMVAAPAQHASDKANAEAQHLDHALSFLQDLISQNNNNANSLN